MQKKRQFLTLDCIILKIRKIGSCLSLNCFKIILVYSFEVSLSGVYQEMFCREISLQQFLKVVELIPLKTFQEIQVSRTRSKVSGNRNLEINKI